MVFYILFLEITSDVQISKSINMLSGGKPWSLAVASLKFPWTVECSVHQ